MLGYYCAYYRYYHPLEFLTSFLNNAANDDDILNGTIYANKRGIKITMPKWGVSRGGYAYDTERNIIAKGLSSVKYVGTAVADQLYHVAHERKYNRFIDVLKAINEETKLNSRVLDILIKIDFFSEFGNQRELFKVVEIFEMFKKGEARQIAKQKVDSDAVLKSIVEKYAVGTTKAGKVSTRYVLLDVWSILEELEDYLKTLGIEDVSARIKIQNSIDALGYIGYVSNDEADYRKLYVLDVYPLKVRRTGEQWAYSVTTQSIGTGKQTRLTVKNACFNREPIAKGDIIYCTHFYRDRDYLNMDGYAHVY